MSADPPPLQPDARAATLTLRETLRRLRVDRARLLQRCGERRDVARAALGSPAFACVVLYRLARYCQVRDWRLRARLLWQLNMLLTGADISPIADLGEGLVIVHPVAVTIVGSAGCRLTVEGHGGLGGGLSLDDIGAGPGLPLLGDDVHLARGAMVLGPVRVGHSVIVGPGCTVVRDVPGASEVLAHELRVARAPSARREAATADTGTHGRE